MVHQSYRWCQHQHKVSADNQTHTQSYAVELQPRSTFNAVEIFSRTNREINSIVPAANRQNHRRIRHLHQIFNDTIIGITEG